ncbi:kunitz-type serine protease inhibitor bitisilin-3-like [Eublepharis macularius]|uniref:Kunitz-type serine protease inhibitor bitisilin-3-like n=1 Tax=Eublepharis macularius TaxID=481883 RepID=A0AA97JG95_EUBMA|nr:kunitz-type serine protease inhibitor bitisilin-3-like [Eublepharis macularius]
MSIVTSKQGNYGLTAANKDLNPLRDFCSYPWDSGPCRGVERRLFYNATSQKCETFRYGGCLGNLNRFITLEECQRSCGKIEKPGFCLPSPKGLFVECSTACVHDGNCPGPQKCCSYGCSLRCSGPIKDLCLLPAETGPCDNVVLRWFYDWHAKKCQKFTYGGCAGNKNNFRTHKACQSRCAQQEMPLGVEPGSFCMPSLSPLREADFY